MNSITIPNLIIIIYSVYMIGFGFFNLDEKRTILPIHFLIELYILRITKNTEAYQRRKEYLLESSKRKFISIYSIVIGVSGIFISLYLLYNGS